MEIYTMVIVACISGEPNCTQARVSEMGFTSLEACEARVDPIVSSMTTQFATQPELKGKQVTYDVSCMNRQQLQAKLGVVQNDM